jgi:hypothetical protein
VDQDLDGQPDRTAIDIMRPKATNEGLKVPAIIDPSPYSTTLGRGSEGQLIADLDGDGLNDRWPLFDDNYFVPRGYAFLHAHMDGTGFSSGCPMHGSTGDIESMKAVIDWLNGRRPGVDKDGDPVTAPWHTGKAGAVHVPDVPERRGHPRRPPARGDPGRQLHAVQLGRRDDPQRDHARHEAQQGAAARPTTRTRTRRSRAIRRPGRCSLPARRR